MSHACGSTAKGRGLSRLRLDGKFRRPDYVRNGPVGSYGRAVILIMVAM